MDFAPGPGWPRAFDESGGRRRTQPAEPGSARGRDPRPHMWEVIFLAVFFLEAFFLAFFLEAFLAFFLAFLPMIKLLEYG